MEPSLTDSKIKLTPPPQDWLVDARGLVRVWRCDWLVDAMAQAIPSTIVIKVTEHRIVEKGYEHLSVSWATPYRQDLTPNLSYYRITPESTVTVNGNSRGPRAVVYGSAGYSIEKTAVYEFFANPLEAFVGKNFSQAVLAYRGARTAKPAFRQSMTTWRKRPAKTSQKHSC